MCTSVRNVFKDLQLENEELKVVESIFSEVTYKKGIPFYILTKKYTINIMW